VCSSESKTSGQHNLKLTSIKNRTNRNQKEGRRKLNAGANKLYKKKQNVHSTLKGAVYQSVFGIFMVKSSKNVPMPDRHIWHSDYAVGWVTKVEFSSCKEQEFTLL
jgi:hypothetical protein